MDLHDLKVLALDRYESDFQKPTDLELHCLQRRGWGGGGKHIQDQQVQD